MQHLLLRRIAAVVLALLLSHDCLAGIRPSFMLEHCAWHASDIVVVSQNAAADGKLTVLETWKGAMQEGDLITISSLTDYAPKVSNPFGGKEPPIKAVTGQRMILFLVRGATMQEASSQPTGVATQPEIIWSSASIFDEMNVSMVWVEKGQVYNFIQVINPGPSLLVAREQTEEQFKKDVEAVLEQQAKVQTVLSIKTPSERARALKPMASGVCTNMREAALEGIAACGKDGLPVVREMLADESYDQRSVIDTLVKAGGKDSGAEITAILKQELEYWRKLGPSLQIGWWNGTGLKSEERTLYQNRYGRLYACLYNLRALKYAEASETVEAVRDFWQSLPQLDDKSGLNQISEECDAILKTLASQDTP